MNKKQLSAEMFNALVAILLLLLVLSGCIPLEAGANSGNVTDTNPGEPGQQQAGGIEIGIEPTPTPEQLTYTNATYAFEFQYPVTWTLTEEDHGIVLQKGADRLGISFRWSGEQVDHNFGRTGMGAGDFVYAGKLNFLGQVIPAEVLTFEKKSKAVFYGEGGSSIEVEDLVFMMVLEDLETDYEEVDLSEEIMAEARAILESFKRIETTAGTGATTGASPLEATLKFQSSQMDSGEPVILNFVLKNNSAEPLYLLKWYTPLEGVAGDIFEVFRDGESLPYLGPLATRAEPTPDSYIFLEPGKSAVAEVNLATDYDFSQPGTYTIRYRSPRISHLAASEAEIATTLDELGPVNIPSDEVTIEISGSPDSAGLPARRTSKEAGEMISAYLLEQNPGLMEAPPLTFEEFPNEDVWAVLQGQVFVVTEGIFKNEAFLLRKDRVVQLGTELGGQGLISMVITDLDQDGQPELLFTYGAGLSPQMSAGTQTRVGMYAPYIDQERVIEANMAYMGIAAIRADDLAAASLYRLDGDQENLGKLSIEYSEIGTALVFQVNPDLPEEIKQSILTGD